MDPLRAEVLRGHPATAALEKLSAASQALAASPRVAVLVPCYNEAFTVAGVVKAFQAELPSATVYVYDNNSTDDTAAQARAAGAVVRKETLQGKGNVIRRMFADIDADIYVLVDGDGTYDASSALAMIDKLLDEDLDMVNAARDASEDASYRRGHRFGNRLLTGIVSHIFGNRLTDMLSGYRVFSRRFAKSFPGLSHGFEIETELTVHALELRLPIAEVRAPYGSRPPGSMSKLGTIRDGIRVLWTILVLIKEERPLPFFSLIAASLALASIVVTVPIFITFMETGLVPRVPTAVLATGMMVLGFLSLACGLILDTVTRGRRELKRLHYLSLPK
jgi:glycosyltransferase involved in cell wall biosynthesis